MGEADFSTADQLPTVSNCSPRFYRTDPISSAEAALGVDIRPLAKKLKCRPNFGPIWSNGSGSSGRIAGFRVETANKNISTAGLLTNLESIGNINQRIVLGLALR